MTPSDLLEKMIKRKIPRARVEIIYGSGGYEITVRSDYFRGQPSSESESAVYQSLDNAPLELVARIAAISCSDS